MGKFRLFFEGKLGLGNLGAKMHQFCNDTSLDAKIGGALVSSDLTRGGAPDRLSSFPLHRQSTDLTIPQVTKTGVIEIFDWKRNPIYMRLSDGTELTLSYDQLNNITKGKPDVGKTVTVIFQRHPQDFTDGRSKIDKFIVHEAT
jgi:hypothetical protein